MLTSNDFTRHLFMDSMVPILLDRRVSHKLEKTVYPDSRSTDVTPKSDHSVSPLPGEDHDSGLSFSFCDRSNPNAGILLETQAFLHYRFYQRHYCSKGLGTTSHAPIAAVAFDMIDLVTYLSKITTSSDQHTVSWFLEDFLHSHPNLRSLTPTQGLEDRWPVVRGFLYDLFLIVAGLKGCYYSETCGYDTQDLEPHEDPDWARFTLPGPDLLVGRPPIDPASVSDGPIEELDAAFICSGPFKMRFTNFLDRHLELNTVKSELLVYWEDTASRYLWALGRVPSRPTTPHWPVDARQLQQYRAGHCLRGFVLSHSGF
jgi:hypothetical protein